MTTTEPGGLDDLGAAGRAAWRQAIADCLDAVLPPGKEQPFLLPAPDDQTAERTGPDWTGLPARVVTCLGRARALEVLDERRDLQEEYLEWRVVRDDDDRILRVEFTTELRDYWRILAAYEPDRTLELAAELTGRQITARDVYGGRVPSSPLEREQRFVDTTIKASNPITDGRAGILFMTHRDNDLHSLMRIANAAAWPCVLTDEITRRSRCATADETIPLLKRSAVAGRASDPCIVERLGRLAFEHRLIAFDEPVGIYVQGVEHTRLRTPRGEAVPTEWFSMSRGLSAENGPDGRARIQRVVFEVPRGHDLVVGQLIDAATEQPITHGGQVAELIQLRLLLRASPAQVSRSDSALAFDPNCAGPELCADIVKLVANIP